MDHSRKIITLPMDERKVLSFSSLCSEATGQDAQAGWPGPVARPIGEYPDHWSDGLHELYGHGLRTDAKDREGERLLCIEMDSLMVQSGVEYAYDDVTNASLNPSLVRKARDLEMKLFTDMGVYERVPRSQLQQIGV